MTVQFAAASPYLPVGREDEAPVSSGPERGPR